MKKILVGIPDFKEVCPDALELLLDKGFTVDLNPYGRSFSFSELAPIIAEYDAVLSELELWDKNLFSLAKKLKILSRNGVGLDNIDLAAAKEAGVCITNAKGMNVGAVANMAIGLMLAVLKKIACFDREMHSGKWNKVIGQDLDGKTIGFLGFGQIAYETAKRLSGFPIKMIAYNRSPIKTDCDNINVEQVDFRTLLSRSDIVTIHMPHTPETHHIINATALKQMKNSAVLINTSRGGLVDGQALYDALVSKEIAAAGLDVYEVEPVEFDNKLITLENVVCTPHVAGYSKEACQAIGYQICSDVVDFFEGKMPKMLVQR